MSTTIADNENVPLFLGLAVVVIILIAFFTSRKDDSPPGKKGKKSKSVARSTPAPGATTSKKKKKKSKAKSASGAAAPPAEKKAAAKEEKESTAPVSEPELEPEPEVKAAPKKKKKKAKKKGGAAASGLNSSDSKKAAAVRGDDDDESDDDVDLWRIQSAANRKGASDAAKRAAANKERDRIRALKRQEERAKAAEAKAAAEAAAAAEEKARREAEEAAAAAEAAAAQAAVEEEKKRAEAEAAAARAKKNGASVNGGADDAAAGGGEKKKRKRKKKKVAQLEELAPRDPLVKPAASTAERWEVVPQVEEWQEVNSKRMKQKAKMEAAEAEAAEAAATEVFLLSDEAPADDEPTETSVTIAAGDDPLIFIGKGGSTIQGLQDTTGAKFHLDREKNMLTISGMQDAVQHGLEEARSILAAEAERKADEAEERVEWGSDAIKAVIGRGGSNIRATQDATGVRIDADVEAGTLVIIGPSEQVSEALTMCHNAAFGESQDVIELGSRNAVNLVYGPGFQTIRDLQDSTGCKLDIQRGSTTLKLAGSTEAVEEATAKINELLEANRGFEMTIENSKVGAVYGKGGETLRSIQDRTGTQIDVSRGPTHATVSVMGTEDASARARIMLQRAIDGEVELGPGEVAEDVELGSATAAVIGRGGSKVAELEKTHEVKINVRSELHSARVVGKPDKVEAAVKDIAAIAKPILEAEEAQKKADEALENGESAWQVDPDDDDAEGW